MVEHEWFAGLKVGDVVVVSRHMSPDRLATITGRSAKYVTIEGVRFNASGRLAGGGYFMATIAPPRPGQAERIDASLALEAALRKMDAFYRGLDRSRQPHRSVPTEALVEAAALVERAVELLQPRQVTT